MNRHTPDKQDRPATARMRSDAPHARVLSTTLTVASYPRAIAELTALIDRTSRESPAPSIVLANVHVVTEAALRPPFHQAVSDAAMVLPDGMPLVWAMRMQGATLDDRCYGPEFMARVIATSQDSAWSHYLYGTTDETLATLQDVMRTRWPRAIVAGRQSPPFGPFDDAAEMANIEKINASGATIVWVGLGCPKQELWMQRYRRHLRGCVVIASGTAFDFIAGVKPQAPAWMQRSGLEWLFRLASEPRRLWKRYLLRNPYFIVQFALQMCRLRWRHPPAKEST